MKSLKALVANGILFLAGVMSLPTTLSTPRSLVIWHGLGDVYNAQGIQDFMDEIKEIHPGIFIHSIYVDTDPEADKKAGFFGRLDLQLEAVHEELLEVPELQNGFDGIGFSQGGQFLRAYVELYNNPPMHNLITFGAQHMGVSNSPPCKPFDILCRLVLNGLKQGVYSEWAQNNIIQAQYFRDPARIADYYAHNRWLPYINNELADQRNTTYAKHLASLSNLVLVVFSKDVTVVPKESGWFGSYPPLNSSTSTSGEELAFEVDEAGNIVSSIANADPPLPIITLREQQLYKEDWLGLKELDERGGITLASCDGVHMELGRHCWEPFVRKYVGWVEDASSFRNQNEAMYIAV